MKAFQFKFSEMLSLTIMMALLVIAGCAPSMNGEQMLEILNGDKSDKQQAEKIIADVYFNTYKKKCEFECDATVLNEVVANYLVRYENKRRQDARELIKRAIEDDNGDLLKNKKRINLEFDSMTRDAVNRLYEAKEKSDRQNFPPKLNDD